MKNSKKNSKKSSDNLLKIIIIFLGLGLLIFLGVISYFRSLSLEMVAGEPVKQAGFISNPGADLDPYVIKVPEDYLEENRQPSQVFISSVDPWTGTLGAEEMLIFFGSLGQDETKQAYQEIRQWVKDNPQEAVFFYKDFSLTEEAEAAAEAAHCAGQQGKFWDYLDLLMTKNEEELSNDLYLSLANDLSLNSEDFVSCLDSDEMMAPVKSSYFYGRSIEIKEAPVLYINDVKFESDFNQDNLNNYLP